MDFVCSTMECILIFYGEEWQTKGIPMAQVSFRMDDDLEMAADETFRSMGMTLSTAINMFVAQTVRLGQFPFAIKADPFYSEASMAVLRRRAADVEAGRHLVEHELAEAGEASHAPGPTAEARDARNAMPAKA